MRFWILKGSFCAVEFLPVMVNVMDDFLEQEQCLLKAPTLQIRYLMVGLAVSFIHFAALMNPLAIVSVKESHQSACTLVITRSSTRYLMLRCNILKM